MSLEKFSTLFIFLCKVVKNLSIRKVLPSLYVEKNFLLGKKREKNPILMKNLYNIIIL